MGIANANRGSIPITVAVITPPQEIPDTPIRVGSTPGWARRRECARMVAPTAWYINWSSRGSAASP